MKHNTIPWGLIMVSTCKMTLDV